MLDRCIYSLNAVMQNTLPPDLSSSEMSTRTGTSVRSWASEIMIVAGGGRFQRCLSPRFRQ